MGRFGREVEEGVGSHDCALPPSPCLPLSSPWQAHACASPELPVRQRAQRNFFSGALGFLG